MKAISKFINGCTGGSFDTPFCARAFRNAYAVYLTPRQNRIWRRVVRVLDFLHPEKDHCLNCYIRHTL